MNNSLVICKLQVFCLLSVEAQTWLIHITSHKAAAIAYRLMFNIVNTGRMQAAEQKLSITFDYFLYPNRGWCSINIACLYLVVVCIVRLTLRPTGGANCFDGGRIVVVALGCQV